MIPPERASKSSSSSNDGSSSSSGSRVSRPSLFGMMTKSGSSAHQHVVAGHQHESPLVQGYESEPETDEEHGNAVSPPVVRKKGEEGVIEKDDDDEGERGQPPQPAQQEEPVLLPPPSSQITSKASKSPALEAKEGEEKKKKKEEEKKSTEHPLSTTQTRSSSSPKFGRSSDPKPSQHAVRPFFKAKVDSLCLLGTLMNDGGDDDAPQETANVDKKG